MAFIGNQPAESFTSFATQEFSTSATTSYTLDHAVTNENEIALFVNNVRQQPGSGKAYTASGTALTLSAATASTDTMYCVFLGRALQTVTPATNSVTSSMLGSNFFTGATDVGGALADADLLLIDDGAGGTLRKTAMSRVKTYVGGGITVADQWRITSTYTYPSSGSKDLNSNWERIDTDSPGYIGTAMTESSGIFTFPSTGKYLIHFFTNVAAAAASNYIGFYIQVTEDNSSYSYLAANWDSADAASRSLAVSAQGLFDVTDTSTHKVKFNMSAAGSGHEYQGNTGYTITGATFIRLGDT